MVNPDANGYTKTRNHRKILRKMQQRTEKQKNTKTKIKAK